MIKRLIALLGAPLVFLGVVTLASPASAEPNPPGCDRGAFCIYGDWNQREPLLLETQGNWSGSLTRVYLYFSVFNNGHPYPGADHVQLTWRLNSNGQTYTRCYPYNPGPGEYKGNFYDVTFTRIQWRGEC